MHEDLPTPFETLAHVISLVVASLPGWPTGDWLLLIDAVAWCMVIFGAARSG